MSTCNRLDLQTLGSQPIVPKNLPDHWSDTNGITMLPLQSDETCNNHIIKVSRINNMTNWISLSY